MAATQNLNCWDNNNASNKKSGGGTSNGIHSLVDSFPYDDEKDKTSLSGW